MFKSYQAQNRWNALCTYYLLLPNEMSLTVQLSRFQKVRMQYLVVIIASVFILSGCKDDFTSTSFYGSPQSPSMDPNSGTGLQQGQAPTTELQADEDLKNPPKKIYSIGEILKKYSVAVPADILFVIDNSGSMASHQQAVIANMNQFISNFSQLPDLDWKMGLLSSDLVNPPYVGFSNTGTLDSKTANAAQVFAQGVAQLGIAGSGRERFYDPVKQAFTNYPDFNRANAILDLVFITDTDDQSDQTSTVFSDYLKQAFPADKKIKVFGVYNQGADFTCNKTDDLVWNWATSRHLALINAGLPTKTYKLCDPNFGQKLLDLATGLVLSSAKSEIQLQDVIDASSLVIKYNGKVLVLGQDYNYVEAQNLVQFPNLDFATDPSLPVKIYYNLK